MTFTNQLSNKSTRPGRQANQLVTIYAKSNSKMASYIKFSADHLFDGFNMLEADSVLILTEDGTVHDIITKEEAGDDIQHIKGIISPGFINCHCHLELSHMKGRIQQHTGLVEFVSRVIKERHLPEEEILKAIHDAEDEMIANGIVAVGDICNNALTIPQKLKGRIWYHNFIEASGYKPEVATTRFEHSVNFFRAYGQLYSIPIESNSITPHAPYSVAGELWQKMIHFPGNHLFSVHNQESPEENRWFINKEGEFNALYAGMNIDTSEVKPSGKTSLQTYLPLFLKNQSIILVHNVATSLEDVRFAKELGIKISWCLCPNANLYIANVLPPVDLFMNEDCMIVLGTDSLASNEQLSILNEMKTIQKNFPAIETATLLKWATSNGSKALQLDSVYGILKKGRKPGINQVSEDLSTVKRLA